MNRIIGIAINEYEDKQLKNLNNCLNDVNKIVTLLRQKYKFDDFELFTQKEQTTRGHLFNKLQDIFTNSLKEDNILLIYAGHGEHNDILNASYILPSDSKQNDSSTWLNLNEIIQFINASKAKHISVISDSCFSGALVQGLKRGGGYDALENKKSRLALTSGGIEKVSDGEINSNSPFTEALCKVLEKNENEKISFSSLAEAVIIEFNPSKQQTPVFGVLKETGHESGSFILELQPSDSGVPKYSIEKYSLDLNLGLPINIEYVCELPQFTFSNYFDIAIVNSAIQAMAFDTLSNARKFILDDYEFILERGKELPIGLEINHKIIRIDDNYLSLILTVYSYMGGVHPNDYVYSLNISFNPEVKLSLNDVISFKSNFQESLTEIVSKYAEEEIRDSLNNYLEYIEEDNLDFAFNNKTLYIYLSNHLPRAIHAGGYIEIPLNELEHSITE